MSGAVRGLRFRLPAPTAAGLLSRHCSCSLRGRYHGAIERSRVTVNGLDLGAHDLSSAETVLELPVDALRAYEVVDISLEHAGSRERPSGDNRRDLAFALSAIAVTPHHET
ncbi:MAG: hypothetical protein U5K56_18480 [Halioglobus sp.]|nr:hypothetical protein [Halioglobus sp.]